MVREDRFLFEAAIFSPLLSSQFEALNDCGQIDGRFDIPCFNQPTVGGEISTLFPHCL